MALNKLKFGNLEVTPDPANVIKHGQRNRSLVRQSLEENGAGRSILLDEDDMAVVGNLTAETASELGFKLKIVDIGPNELLAARRLDLTPEQKKAMRLADNLAGSARDRRWDNSVLDDYDEAMLLRWFDPVELKGVYPDGLDSYKEPEFHSLAPMSQGSTQAAFSAPGEQALSDERETAPPPVPDSLIGDSEPASLLAPKSAERHPLAIVLSNPELRAWTGIKKELGVRGDKEALLQLINYHKVS